MSSKMQCPGCQRQITKLDQPGTMVCDGCELQFDPALIQYQPAVFWRRVVGWALLALAGLMLLSVFRIVLTKLNRHDMDFTMRMVGLFLLPALAFLVGKGLMTGKNVLVESPIELADSPKPAKPDSSGLE